MPPHAPRHTGQHTGSPAARPTPGDPGETARRWASESERVSREVREHLAGLAPRDADVAWTRDTAHDEREQG